MAQGEVPRKVAIMQPYLFPYLGYFQLIAAVDEFWLLDDVQYIQQGWMNRNRLTVDGKEWLFTIPVNKHPRIDLIRNKYFVPSARYAVEKLGMTVSTAYARAPYMRNAVDLIAAVAEQIASSMGPADFTQATRFALEQTCAILGLNTAIKCTSSLSLDSKLTGQARVIAACRSIGAETYINMWGGRALYDREAFAAAGLSLWFLKPAFPAYYQGKLPFVPGLSILDAIAHLSPNEIAPILKSAELVRT